MRPFAPVLSSVLYESIHEAQLWNLYDANKKYIKSGDCFSQEYKATLPKGDYTLELQVRMVIACIRPLQEYLNHRLFVSSSAMTI